MNKPIFELTGWQELDILLVHINDGVDVNIQDDDMDTALILASADGDIDIVKLLLEKGADVNIQNDRGNTALMKVCYGGNIDICRFLIENGADVNIKNYDGDTALICASYSGYANICKLLIENNADIDIENGYGDTAIDAMKDKGIYKKVEPIINRIEGLKHFKEVFKEYAESYMDIFETTLYSQDLDLNDIKANINMFYSTIVLRMENNSINENVEL